MSGEAGPPRLEIRLLGPFDVLRDGAPVELGAYRQRALLALLVLHANEIVPRGRLIEELWGERAPESAANMVQVYVSRLRKALGTELLVTQTPGYVLRSDRARIDAVLFEQLVERSREELDRGAVLEAREHLHAAIAIVRGEPLADFGYESFARAAAARLEEMRLEAVELRIDADLALGRHAQLVAELEELIHRHPFREHFRSQLMLSLYRSGRQAEALEAYRAARQALVEELGIEPRPALRELERAILEQDPALNVATPRPTEDGRRSQARTQGNLPAELTSLVGRDYELSRIADLVHEHRTVTVVGPGGVGKTRVAQRVAGEAAAVFPGGVWFVDLAAISHGDDVADAVASVLAIHDRAGEASLDTVAYELGERRLLLVLDNCEHVLASAAEAATRLALECPGVRILATSREPLAIVGERVERLEPLATTASGSDLPDAVRLFLERAETHGAAWKNQLKVLDTIRELCVRLDGIPLAVELAAARTRAISPGELLANLDDRLRLLTRPRHWSAPDRHQTLEATIAWSYERLGEPEQATLRRLAVFHGRFSLAAAAAVCADIGSELDTLERVTALIDRSVLSMHRRDQGDCYRLLESIALFAAERLHERREDVEARHRHARFFQQLAGEVCGQTRGVEQAEWAARLDLEQDNLIAALSWCLEGGGDPTAGAELATNLGLHWMLRGRTNVAKRWLERALELRERIGPRTRAAVNVVSGELAYTLGDVEGGLACATDAVALARRAGDDGLLTEALAVLALSEHASRRDTEMTAVAAELRSLRPRLSRSRALVMGLLGTALAALAAGDLDEAAADAQAARAIARDAGDHVWAFNSGFWLAYALALDSEIHSARSAIVAAESDAVRSGYQLLVADSLGAEAVFAVVDSDFDTAGNLMPTVVDMMCEQGRWQDVGRSLRLAAGMELKRDAPDRSAVLLGASRRWTSCLDFQDELLLPELADLDELLAARLGEGLLAELGRQGSEMTVDGIASFLAAS
jgi:predicted ATPase/DNA-binding SARP family transcriptional activator